MSKAEAAQAAGKEPLAGEHVGTAGGGQRLTDTYWDRQKQLEQDVTAARAELAAARAAPVPQSDPVKETGGPKTGRPPIETPNNY